MGMGGQYPQHGQMQGQQAQGQGVYYADPSETGSSVGGGAGAGASVSSGSHYTSTNAGGSNYAYGASPYPPLGAVYFDERNQGSAGRPSPGTSLPTTATTTGGGTDSSSGGTTPPPGQGMSMPTPMLMPAPPPGASAKEREAFAARYANQHAQQQQQQQQYHMHSPQSPQSLQGGQGGYGGYGYGASGAPLTLRNATDADVGSVLGGGGGGGGGAESVAGSRVVVHQDGGRVPQEREVEDEMPPTEIPPTYESIRSDETGH